MSDLLVLDGGCGHLLKSKGIDKLSPELKYEELFAAGSLANADHPDVVQAMHEDYINSGCDILTTNTFGCTKWSLGKIGKGELAVPLAGQGAKLARDVAARTIASTGKRILVAGSLPPLMESYQTTDLHAFEDMQPQYEELAAALEPHVDFFLCETMSTITEAVAAASVVSKSGRKPWWVSFTLEDTTHAQLLRSGETLQDAVRAVLDFPGLEAVLINCCAPQVISPSLPVLRAAVPSNLRIGAYGNGFQTPTSEWLGQGSSTASRQLVMNPEDYELGSDTEGSSGIIKPEAYARYAKEWLAEGASIIGGCCGISPAHIAELAKLKK